MAEYIDRQSAIDAITDWYGEIYNLGTALANVPSADVQPVRHGQWIGISYDGYADGNPVFYEWKCSECGKIVVADDANELNYCCNCGSRMDGEQNEQ